MEVNAANIKTLWELNIYCRCPLRKLCLVVFHSVLLYNELSLALYLPPPTHILILKQNKDLSSKCSLLSDALAIDQRLAVKNVGQQMSGQFSTKHEHCTSMYTMGLCTVALCQLHLFPTWSPIDIGGNSACAMNLEERGTGP